MDGGYASGTFLNTTSYITVVFTPDDGIYIYQNGDLVKHWNASTALNGEGEAATVDDYTDAFLGLAQIYGVTIVSASAEDAIVERKMLTDDEVAARYAAYLEERSYYPVHEHVYSPETDLCGCGEQNPSHVHRNWKNGLCGICGAACTHVFGADGNCTVCDMKIEQVTTTYNTANNPNFATGFDGNATKYMLYEGQTVTLTTKITANANTAAYSGIVTQLWSDMNLGTELAFHQGNNWALRGTFNASWNDTQRDDGLTGIGDGVNKSNYVYRITVSFVNDTVTVTYEAWASGTIEGEASNSGTITYTGISTYSAMVVGFGPDGVTLGETTVAHQNVVPQSE